MTAIVRLSSGDEAIVDDEDFALVSQFKWHLKPSVTKNRTRKYAKANMKIGSNYMHRFILGNPDGVIDHINGNGLDNRRLNLRICTQAENAKNVLYCFSKSGLFGVYQHFYCYNKGKRFPRNKQWQAVIRINGKNKSLGYFLTAEEAALARNSALDSIGDEFSSRSQRQGIA